MSWPKLVVLIVAIAVVGFLLRYGSLDPCDWLRHDVAAKSGLPRIMVEALMKAQLEGSQMSGGQCFEGWVRLHTEGLPK